MRTSLQRFALATLATVTLGAGCFADPNKTQTGGGGGWGSPSTPTSSPDGGDSWGTPSTPTNPDTPPTDDPPSTPDPLYAGSYLVKTKLDITDKGVLPGPTGAIIAFLADLDTKPFTAFLYLLKDAGIPTVSAGLQSVPQWILDAGGAVGDAIIKDTVFEPYPDVKNVLVAIANVGEMFQTLELHNQISIGGKISTDTYKITQQFVAVGFEWNGQKKVYNMSAAARANAIIKGKSLNVTNVKTYADFDGMFDGGTIDLPIGELMINAINDLVLSPFGYTSLGNLLAEAFPCEALAAEVDIESVETYCELGITALAEVALKPIKEFSLKGVVVGHGSMNGFDRKAAEAQDYTTDKLKGAQSFSLLVNNTKIEVKDAPFEGERLLTPITPPQW